MPEIENQPENVYDQGSETKLGRIYTGLSFYLSYILSIYPSIHLDKRKEDKHALTVTWTTVDK